MKLIVEVDYKNGYAIPDGKAEGWALESIQSAKDSTVPTRVSASTSTMLLALQVLVKSQALGSGSVEFHYIANDAIVPIDSDGNITKPSGLDDENTHQKLLMNLL
ncbi:hypothetical protein KW882_01470 [Vibrio parahaemolyticus]